MVSQSKGSSPVKKEEESNLHDLSLKMVPGRDCKMQIAFWTNCALNTGTRTVLLPADFESSVATNSYFMG